VRKADWKEVKEVVKGVMVGLMAPVIKRARSEWLSLAELVTSSQSRHVLPGSIFLSHQFHFFALCEDYHALIRQAHFDVPVVKIDVRKEVEVSAYAAGNGEDFVSGGGSSPQDIRRGRSSFDEPLQSALAMGLEYDGSSPPVIPMLPNGYSGPMSFKAASLPIRHVAAGLSDGVGEGLRQLKREIGKVRSPRLLPRSEEHLPMPVPLEFDEMEEDFLIARVSEEDEATSRGTSRGEGDSGASASVSTPSTSAAALVPGLGDSAAAVAEGLWEGEGWTAEDHDAVAEAEQFDEISAAGMMDEEQERVRVPERGTEGEVGLLSPAPKKGKKGRKGK